MSQNVPAARELFYGMKLLFLLLWGSLRRAQRGQGRWECELAEYAGPIRHVAMV